MIRTLWVGVGLFAALPGVAEASWFLNTAGATLSAGDGLAVETPFGPPITVGPGTEFTGRILHGDQALGFSVQVDVSPYDIVIGIVADRPGTSVTGGPGLLGITLTGLASAPPILLTRFACAEPGGVCSFPAAPAEFSFTDNLPAALTIGLTALQDGAEYTLAIPIPNEVPAPASLAVLAVGVAGLTAAGRRRRRAASCA
ncbi:hypothetical protein [Roseomonas sp. AR75]|uniref:hypothetical protein n=1 Tax=Roseomonas sp. AR75 TaxID=2562311 RepID=UPI0010C07F0A|nr:hypothetical protein [Roseomonas sp. AR75]